MLRPHKSRAARVRVGRILVVAWVRDRVVQAALRLVIETILEREFLAHRVGFRPKRGCKNALREMYRLLQAGYTHVVDGDLKAYFDSVPHSRLLADIGPSIAMGQALGLLEDFLKDILKGLAQWTSEPRSLQGAIINPLLANLYLQPVDVAMAKAGFEMIRYTKIG